MEIYILWTEESWATCESRERYPYSKLRALVSTPAPVPALSGVGLYTIQITPERWRRIAMPRDWEIRHSKRQAKETTKQEANESVERPVEAWHSVETVAVQSGRDRIRRWLRGGALLGGCDTGLLTGRRPLVPAKPVRSTQNPLTCRWRVAAEMKLKSEQEAYPMESSTRGHSDILLNEGTQQVDEDCISPRIHLSLRFNHLSSAGHTLTLHKSTSFSGGESSIMRVEWQTVKRCPRQEGQLFGKDISLGSKSHKP
jgi:hypothetical protein